MSGDCPECGGQLIWGGMSWHPHSDHHHTLRRKLLLKGVARRLREEVAFRQKAQEAGQLGMVRVQWRITCLLGERKDMWGGLIGGRMWDRLSEDDRQHIIARLGRDLRDEIEQTHGIRPHHMHVKYRIYDGRMDQ